MSDDSLEQPDDRPTVPTYTTNGGAMLSDKDKMLTEGDLKLLSGSGVFLSVKAAGEIRQLRQSLAEAQQTANYNSVVAEELRERVRLLEAVREAAQGITELRNEGELSDGTALNYHIDVIGEALAAAKEPKKVLEPKA